MMPRLFLGIGVIGIVLLGAAQPAAAAVPPQLRQFAACEQKPADFLGFESWDACLRSKYDGKVEFKELSDVWLVVLPLLNDLLKATTYIATGFVIWGGIQYIKSQGDPMSLKNARQTIKNAIVGLLICLLSVAMVQFISSGLIR